MKKQTIANKSINRIYGHGRGWCFTPKIFLDLGSPKAILRDPLCWVVFGIKVGFFLWLVIMFLLPRD